MNQNIKYLSLFAFLLFSFCWIGCDGKQETVLFQEDFDSEGDWALAKSVILYGCATNTAEIQSGQLVLVADSLNEGFCDDPVEELWAEAFFNIPNPTPLPENTHLEIQMDVDQTSCNDGVDGSNTLEVHYGTTKVVATFCEFESTGPFTQYVLLHQANLTLSLGDTPTLLLDGVAVDADIEVTSEAADYSILFQSNATSADTSNATLTLNSVKIVAVE